MSPLPPPDLLPALNPAPQILLFGDGLPYNGFWKSFSIADMAHFERNKLIGLVSFAILPNFAPFQDEPPFFSHRTIVKQIVAMLRVAKKQDKPTTFWLAYNARSNVADVELASVLDRRIDLVPSLGFLWLSVVCQVVHMGVRSPNTHHISTAPTPLDQPLVLSNSHHRHSYEITSPRPLATFRGMLILQSPYHPLYTRRNLHFSKYV